MTSWTHITIHHYLILSTILFVLGFVGLVIRRNLIINLMCIEVMMNGINLSFIAISRYLGEMDGQVMAIFVMAIAAVEAAIGLGIIIALFRNKQTLKTSDLVALKG